MRSNSWGAKNGSPTFLMVWYFWVLACFIIHILIYIKDMPISFIMFDSFLYIIYSEILLLFDKAQIILAVTLQNLRSFLSITSMINWYNVCHQWSPITILHPNMAIATKSDAVDLVKFFGQKTIYFYWFYNECSSMESIAF